MGDITTTEAPVHLNMPFGDVTARGSKEEPFPSIPKEGQGICDRASRAHHSYGSLPITRTGRFPSLVRVASHHSYGATETMRGSETPWPTEKW